MYYLVYGFIYTLSLLPMGILYLFSDACYLLIYYVIGYRRKVVEDNLRIAFPDRNNQWIMETSRKFYRNFTDNFIETIKLFSAGEKFYEKHFVMDLSPFQYLFEKGLTCQIHLGHNFNWELANLAVARKVPFTLLGVYMPIENKIFERLLKKFRGKYGTVLIPATRMRESIMHYRNQQYMLALVADQVPGNLDRAFWLNFFGKPTPFVQGPEKGARAGNFPVLFAEIRKFKRGHYQLYVKVATENPASLQPGELTRMYRDYLQTVIQHSPDMWLWSHRRWKRSWDQKHAERWIDNTPPPQPAS